MSELIPFIQLGFAALMAIALFMLVRGYMISMLDQNKTLVEYVTDSNDKIALTMENHLSSIAKSLILVEERLSQNSARDLNIMPIFISMNANLNLIKDAIVRSTIVAPGTRATVEPSPLPEPQKRQDGDKP